MLRNVLTALRPGRPDRRIGARGPSGAGVTYHAHIRYSGANPTQLGRVRLAWPADQRLRKLSRWFHSTVLLPQICTARMSASTRRQRRAHHQTQRRGEAPARRSPRRRLARYSARGPCVSVRSACASRSCCHGLPGGGVLGAGQRAAAQQHAADHGAGREDACAPPEHRGVAVDQREVDLQR